ncbi:membrane protein insertion efficiency factor YidD [Desertibaculum subflavum]|uniref:membrane protein insertion efficiency factor YidD n=1 Tax=Desertibaculum subflavum TaxID=2268458 RepID=UPI000E665549
MNLLARAAVLFLRGLIQAYRWFVSPILGVNCRFAPSCSEYALEAVTRHGALGGGALAARRLCRCHPWGGSGFDPVPETFSFTPSSARRTRAKISCDPAR